MFDKSLRGCLGDGNAATVEATEMTGDRAYLYISFGGGDHWIANVDSGTKAEDEKPLEVAFDLHKSHVFDPQTEQAIY